MKKLLAVTIGVAVLGLATGCGTSSKDDTAAKTDQTTTAPTSTAPVETPTGRRTPTPAGPLTAAEYQQSMRELDQKIGSAIEGLNAANNGTNLNNALTGLWQLLDIREVRASKS